ncbi:MAG: subfamily B ATP-binding cassette protein MsbA, partial [Saprospiraceae bacterium]
FIFAFYNIIDPAKSFSREYSNVQRGLAALDRINGFTAKNQYAHIPDGKYFENKITFKEVLQLNHVSLGYGSLEVLFQISFSIRKGEKLGIVGFSGEGKTSILDAILRFYEISNGNVLLDGVDIADLNLTSYRAVFSLVSQEPMLFHGSVQKNILLDKSLDIKKMEQVTAATNISKELLNRKVGDRGVKLSGGQRQRISIARALYQEPQILLLDEPTSELDAQNEREVIEAIMNVLADVSVILISHNVSLLKKMDKIIVLSEGKIESIGEFKDLLTSSSVFGRLIHEEGSQ